MSQKAILVPRALLVYTCLWSRWNHLDVSAAHHPNFERIKTLLSELGWASFVTHVLDIKWPLFNLHRCYHSNKPMMSWLLHIGNKLFKQPYVFYSLHVDLQDYKVWQNSMRAFFNADCFSLGRILIGLLCYLHCFNTSIETFVIL